MIKLTFGVAALLMSTHVFSAEEDTSRRAIYVSAGVAESSGPIESDDTPWALGFLYQPEKTQVFFGGDIAGEGTSLDNTSGKTNKIEQGISVNFVVGRNLDLRGDWGAGVGVLMGARDAGTSCPDSYLGYQCYADETPSSDYEFNYGTMVHLTYKKALIGARISSESSQLMLGVTF